jgi:uncharacterized protein YkwD
MRKHALASLAAGAAVLLMPLYAQAGGSERGSSWDRGDDRYHPYQQTDRAARSACLPARGFSFDDRAYIDRRERSSRRAFIGSERHARGGWASRDRQWRRGEAPRDRWRHERPGFERSTHTLEAEVEAYELELGLEEVSRGAGEANLEADRPHLERAIFDLTNEVRRAHGVAPLSWSDALGDAARYHAADMANHGYFSHDSYALGADGELEFSMSAQQRARAFGVSGGMAENIAYNRTEDASRVVQQWLESEGHRRNLLDPELRTLGVGHHQGFWVQNFGF